MDGHWVRRRSHPRRSKSGITTFVRETWELRPERERKVQVYRHPCPRCGAVVISVHMKRGGWAHFEGAKGLGRVKHPCFNRGEGLGRRRDDMTLDLFDESSASNDGNSALDQDRG
jgi:ribosomal protein S27AE